MKLVRPLKIVRLSRDTKSSLRYEHTSSRVVVGQTSAHRASSRPFATLTVKAIGPRSPGDWPAEWITRHSDSSSRVAAESIPGPW